MDIFRHFIHMSIASLFFEKVCKLHHGIYSSKNMSNLGNQWVILLYLLINKNILKSLHRCLIKILWVGSKNCNHETSCFKKPNVFHIVTSFVWIWSHEKCQFLWAILLQVHNICIQMLSLLSSQLSPS